MGKTFHDLVEACYRGQHLIKGSEFGFDALVEGLPLRDRKDDFEKLISHPSYHFGTMLAAYSDYLDAQTWEEPPFAAAADLLRELGLDRAAIVLDSEVHAGETSIILLDSTRGDQLGVGVATYGVDDRHGASFKNKWLVFEAAGRDPHFTAPIVWLALAALELLAKPEIEYVVRPPSSGMAALRAAREKRGHGTIPDMQTIHLKRRVYIGGVAVGGGTHASPEPHDRSGHWRHSEREIPGWEEVQPTTGEYAGMTVWRKWIKDTPIKGGKPKNAAPQFRVVK